ncbi:acetyltransferase, GNAT family [Alkalibacterium sp. AK22]|uniref:GNAT family N-acetyltransferase n=1 Tax=Alkalibacterium sp. AK22 TaxID=1229520 RepID=UPI00044B24A5|nr:GNAT family N-acetyltransferase [Alkalibacterium sp. AK22]EXJ24489.1 acetyltransferase, GNAT family [Alkalibacterium sp. AK22]
MNSIEVNVAATSQLEVVEQILYDTAVWLNSKGSEQWKGLLKGEDVHNVRQAIERKQVFLAFTGKKPVGTFTLFDTQSEWDADLWSELKVENCVYLHRIAVEKSCHGKNVGAQLIEAAKRIASQKEKKAIRLDCIGNNSKLNAFYQANGFTYVSTVKDYNNGEGLQDYNLYEWKI